MHSNLPEARILLVPFLRQLREDTACTYLVQCAVSQGIVLQMAVPRVAVSYAPKQPN